MTLSLGEWDGFLTEEMARELLAPTAPAKIRFTALFAERGQVRIDSLFTGSRLEQCPGVVRVDSCTHSLTDCLTD